MFYHVKSRTEVYRNQRKSEKKTKRWNFNNISYRSVFCRRPRQSNDRTLTLRDRKNRVTSLRRLVLGAKQPVISHISSQPRSSLALQHHITISAMPCMLFIVTATTKQSIYRPFNSGESQYWKKHSPTQFHHHEYYSLSLTSRTHYGQSILLVQKSGPAIFFFHNFSPGFL